MKDEKVHRSKFFKPFFTFWILQQRHWDYEVQNNFLQTFPSSALHSFLKENYKS